MQGASPGTRVPVRTSVSLGFAFAVGVLPAVAVAPYPGGPGLVQRTGAETVTP